MSEYLNYAFASDEPSTADPGDHVHPTPGPDDHSSHMMMYFHTHIGMSTLLIKGLTPKTTMDFAIACAVIAVITIFYEALKCVRRYLAPKKNTCFMSCIGRHFADTLLHGAQLTISYGLMLIAMTFQIYLYFSIILGAMIGHLLFGAFRFTSERLADEEECCH